MDWNQKKGKAYDKSEKEEDIYTFLNLKSRRLCDGNLCKSRANVYGYRQTVYGKTKGMPIMPFNAGRTHG